jgi:transcription initiation factor TFIIIB Brf1 subunit/transcription initiation factor TFIIB
MSAKSEKEEKDVEKDVDVSSKGESPSVSIPISDEKSPESCDSSNPIESKECQHTDTCEENGILVCQDCGLELSNGVSDGPEWRGGDDDKSHSQIRCSYKRSDQKNIFKELEKYNLSQEIIKLANQYYFKIVNEKILRASTRKAVIFACVFNAFKQTGEFKIPKDLQEIFGLSKSDVSLGIKYFNRYAKDFQMKGVTAGDFIPVIMKKFYSKTDDYHIVNATRILDYVKHNTKELNSSYPQSIAAAVCYYYFKAIGVSISYDKFARFIKMSEVTISKLTHIISDVISKAKDGGPSIEIRC